MAHFAEIDHGGIVQRVIVIANHVTEEDGEEVEAFGVAYCQYMFGEDTIWKRTSYNTMNGVHATGGTPFRKNYASVGFVYLQDIDAFAPPKPFTSWLLNPETCVWEAPRPYPDDNNDYEWCEETLDWVAKEI